MTISIHRAADRYVTETGWARTRHSFAFGPHYDPENTHFGVLLAHNEELVPPGPGYAPHPHREVEIVSWVLDGVLRHEDGAGDALETSSAQLLSAGTGVVHAERAADERPVRFVQMWLQPDRSGPPSYQQADISAPPDALTPVASGDVPAPLRLRQAAATLYVGRGSFEVPAASFLHLFVTRGTAAVAELRLGPGDAARCTDSAAVPVHAGTGEVLVWQMSRELSDR